MKAHERSKPKGDFIEKKKYYSKRHKIYCIKTQVLVTPLGFCIQQSSGYNGGKHDYKIAEETAHELKEILGPNRLLAPINYHGHLEGINKEIPYRKPRNDTLTDVQDLYNKELGHFRVIVENFFACVSKFKFMAERYDYKVEDYSKWIDFGYSLVNYCNSLHPIRAEPDVGPQFIDEQFVGASPVRVVPAEGAVAEPE